jgi:hypothetical protein
MFFHGMPFCASDPDSATPLASTLTEASSKGKPAHAKGENREARGGLFTGISQLRIDFPCESRARPYEISRRNKPGAERALQIVSFSSPDVYVTTLTKC